MVGRMLVPFCQREGDGNPIYTTPVGIHFNRFSLLGQLCLAAGAKCNSPALAGREAEVDGAVHRLGSQELTPAQLVDNIVNQSRAAKQVTLRVVVT